MISRQVVLAVCALLATGAACKSERAPASATVVADPPVLPTKAPEAPKPYDELDPEAQKAATERMLASHAPKRELMVGGCREDCGDPKTAFYNYIRAIAKRDGGASSIPYLEASMMVHDAKRRGDEWVELWRDMRIDERRESIRAFAKDTAAWMERVASPDDLEKALATGVEVELGPETALVRFQHPPLTGPDDTAPTWRFTMYKRGWEWLVSEIDTRAE